MIKFFSMLKTTGNRSSTNPSQLKGYEHLRFSEIYSHVKI